MPNVLKTWKLHHNNRIKFFKMTLLLTKFNVCMNTTCKKRECIGIGTSRFFECQGCGLVKYCSDNCAQHDEWHVRFCNQIQNEHGIQVSKQKSLKNIRLRIYQKRYYKKRDIFLTLGLFAYLEAKRKMNYFSLCQTRELIEKAMSESVTLRSKEPQKNCERLKDASKAIFCAYVHLGDYRGAASVADTQCHGKLVVLLMKWKLIVKNLYRDYEYFPEHQTLLDVLMESPEGTPARRLRGVVPALDHIKKCLLLSKTKALILEEILALKDVEMQKKLKSMIIRDEIPSPQLFYTF